ncbi:MAG: amidohydrolase family protein [Planctomycetota bacterium]
MIHSVTRKRITVVKRKNVARPSLWTRIALSLLVDSLILAAGSTVAQDSKSTPPHSSTSKVSGSNGTENKQDPSLMDGRDGRDLSVREFRPVQKVVLPDHTPRSARFPCVDVHTHFLFRQRGNRQALEDFVDTMDRNRIAVCVSLDGKLGSTLAEHHRFLTQSYPNRFLVFTHLDWRGPGDSNRPETWACNRPGWPKLVAEQLADAKKKGLVSGVKFFKQFGLGHRNRDGSFIRIDDPRFDPIWKACGDLKLPVIIHTGDPAAFFDPIDPNNERWEELSRHPDWSFAAPEFPSRQALLDARNRVIEKHPQTQFIGAHVAGNPENLKVVGQWLDQYPNLWVEFSSRISELGRQDREARKFLIRYQDRVLFGTDGPWPEKRLRAYWRFLQTFDESFDYSEKDPPPQGLWRIDGVGLPADVLKKIYQQNAMRLLPKLRGMVAEVSQQWRERADE